MFRTIEISNQAYSPPGLRFVTVKSAALGQRADILLFVPVQAEVLRDVPLVLLLHGVYGSHWAWAFKGGAHLTAQRLIDVGAIPPLVLAMPSDGLWGDGSGYVRHAEQDFERWIVDEVPAAASAACTACSDASPLFIAGLSMGGFAALRLAGKHPLRFAAAVGLSSVTDVSQLAPLIAEDLSGWAAAGHDRSVLNALTNSSGPLPRLRLDCGLTDPFLAANRLLHANLAANGIAHEYAEHPGGHDWTYWSNQLEDSLRFLTQSWS
jgi:putative tributyrin esterase